MNKHCLLSLAAVGCAAGVAEGAHASFFDLMQIEQVIGGVAGDTTAQAIQLRMRADFQCFVSIIPCTDPGGPPDRDGDGSDKAPEEYARGLPGRIDNSLALPNGAGDNA